MYKVVSQKKESTPSHFRVSELFHVDVKHETLAYCPSTCCVHRPGKTWTSPTSNTESTVKVNQFFFFFYCQRTRLWRIYSSACFLHKTISWFSQIHSLPLGAAFEEVKTAVSPVTLYTKQLCPHKHCFIRHYRHDEKEMKSSISWRQSVSFRYTLI